MEAEGESKLKDVEDLSILSQISEGTVSKVYKCYINDKSQIFAVKIISNENYSRYCYYIQKAYNLEKKILKSISGTLYWIGRKKTKNNFYLIYDLYEGSLKTILKNKSISVHESLVRSIIFHVLHILIELHSHNIIHRDIQPEHILIVTDSDKKIQKVALCGFLHSEIEGYPLNNDTKNILSLNLNHHLGINFEHQGRTHPSIDLYKFGLSLFEFIFNEKFVQGFSENKLRKSILSPGVKRIIESMLILDPQKLPEADEISREYESLTPIPPIETKPNILPYKLLDKLGSGSFGNVFYSINSSNDSKYAIKVINPDHLQNQDEFDLISQEIEILYELKCLPFIVQYEESFFAS